MAGEDSIKFSRYESFKSCIKEQGSKLLKDISDQENMWALKFTLLKNRPKIWI
jgi:hypothetical protein